MVRDYHRSAAENVGIGADAGDAALTDRTSRAVAPVSAVCAAFRTQPSARTRQVPENRTLRRCAGALRERQAQKETACERFSAEEEAASGEAGESQGVVRAPWQTHLPAVRAV